MLLYIDPGTGSMLFTILIGIIGTGIYSLRMLLIRLRFRLGAGKMETDKQKIPLVIFAESKRYWLVFEPICRELDKRGEDVLYITASPDDPALSCPYSHVQGKCIENNNKLFAYLNFINARILLATTPGLDVYQWKRSRDVQFYVHIPHAPSELILYRMFGLDYYDAVLISGDYHERDLRNLEKLRKLPEKELIRIGIPYMDEMVKRLEKSGPAPEHKRTVLLAPTWGSSALFAVYGGTIIDRLKETGYHIIIRPHPQSFTSDRELMEKLMKQYPDSEELEWNRDTDNFEVLRRSDILISDFSGVIFDFALVYDKPVIYTNPNFDLAPYDAWWMNTPLWTTSALPRIGCELTSENMDSVKELIDTCLEDPRYEKGRREVKEETWCCFGEGAVKTVEYLLRKKQELSEA